MRKKLYVIVPIVVIVLVFTAVYVVNVLRDYSEQYPSLRSIVNESKLESMQQKDASGIDVSHLGDGLMPPTNKWFSGIVLQKQPQTVFPTPLSFTPTDNSFTFDLPGVTTNPAGIMASVVQPVKVTVEGATHYVVKRYDEVSVDLTFRSGDRSIGTVTLVAGLPYIYYRGLSDTTLTVDGTATVAGDMLTFRTKDVTSTIAAYDGAHTSGDDAHKITVPKNSLVTMYAAKTSESKTLEQYAKNRVERADVTYKKDGDNFQTTIAYKTANGGKTYFGRLPHQQGGSGGKTYNTIYGPLVMEAGNTLRFTTEQVPVANSLDLSKLSSDERTSLAQTVRQDVNTPHTYPDDSYFGGKALYRDAQLLLLAKQLGENEVATTVQTKLRDGLVSWLRQDGTSSKSFYYDTKVRGVVGVTPSFGSEEFNDHHFHFGYFIYAASVLARYDADFQSTYKDEVNLLVADIANYRSDEALPLRRNFDPYFGHSWASGSSPFADGNNQESSSEAINAWVGVELWAQQIKNEQLAEHASWMLSNEVASTSAYWLDFDRTKAPYVAGYDYSVVSLNWGGKRDYATFFSAEPRAMLGILLLPMSPTTKYMSSYGERITEQLKEARTNPAPAQFEDYLLMYESLAGITNQLERAKQLPDTLIDNANSRSYMYAWIMSQK